MSIRLLLALIIASGCLPAVSHAQWYGSVDSMAMTRSNASSNVFARNQVEVLNNANPPAPTGDVVVGTESRLSLDLDAVAAGRFTIGWRVDEFGIEASYLTTDEIVDRGSVFDPGSMTASPFTPVDLLVSPLLDNNSAVDVFYVTDLQSLELSLTQLVYSAPNGEATLRFGLRAFAIDESFGWQGTNSGGTNSLDVSRENRMIGPQLGLRGWTPFPGGRLSLNIAGAVVFNDIEGTSVTNGPGFAGGFTDDVTSSKASLAGEVGIEYLYEITPTVGLRVGFEVLGLTAVALATNDQLISNDFTDAVGYSYPYVGVVLVR